MPKELLREIRKLEVRLDNLLREEEVFIKELKGWIEKFKELNRNLEELEKGAGHGNVEKLMNLRLEVIKIFSEVMKKGSESEHERSHLLESYGSLLLVMEEKFKELLSNL